LGDKVLLFISGQPGPWSSCFYASHHSWNNRRTSPHAAISWDWGLVNFLPRLILNHNLPNLSLPHS
jgi:hypothetical protein